MLLIILTIGLLAGSIALLYFNKLYDEFDALMAIIFGVALIFELTIALANNFNTQGFIQRKLETKAILEYQLEEGLYNEENNIGLKELYNQINNFNANLINGKAVTHSPWIGIFYNNGYDEIEPIDYRELAKNSNNFLDLISKG